MSRLGVGGGVFLPQRPLGFSPLKAKVGYGIHGGDLKKRVRRLRHNSEENWFLGKGVVAWSHGAGVGAGYTGEPSSGGSALDLPPPSRQGDVNVVETTLEMEEESKRKFHVATFLVLLALGIIAAAITLILTSNFRFENAVQYLCKKFVKSVAVRQAFAITSVMLFVRSGLTPVVKFVRGCFRFKSPWETSTEAYLLQEIYQPLELLLGIAACSALAENILPPLISVQKKAIHEVSRTVLELAFILSASRVGYTFKRRLLQEAKWKMELDGTSNQQRNIEAMEKLSTAGIVLVTLLLGLKSVGLDVHSLLAIGGFGGVVIGFAGREIFENLFSGFLIMSARPFDVGDEVSFYPGGKLVEGIVVDIGWYHTTIRSFEREMYAIPNSVFSKEVVLNITRKGKEWRYLMSIPIRVRDVNKVENIVADIRRILRQDERVLQRLYRRVFLGDISEEHVTIYIAFYMEMPNRDAYLAARQQMTFTFIDCIERNGAQLAEKKLIFESSYHAQVKMPLPEADEFSENSDTELSSAVESRSIVSIPTEATKISSELLLDKNSFNPKPL